MLELGQFPGLWLKEKISYSGENKVLTTSIKMPGGFLFSRVNFARRDSLFDPALFCRVQ